VVLLGCLLIVVLPEGGSYQMAHQAALTMGLAIVMGIVLELRRRLRNVFRIDLLMLVALYGLLFVEFLVPQPQLVFLVPTPLMEETLWVIALGFGGIAVARHWNMRAAGLMRMTDLEITNRALVAGLLICAALGYLHMLVAVGFNPLQMIDAMMGPRFSQPWGRGRLGGVADLLHELGLLIYLIPPAVAVVHARRKSFTARQRAMANGLLALTLFYGFSSGTRNIFAVYVLSYLGGYFLALPRLSWVRLLKTLGTGAFVLLVSSQVMLEFRNVGLKNYLGEVILGEPGYRAPSQIDSPFFVDNNIYTLSLIVDYFPHQAEYLGWEVPFWALVKPIPRAVWPGKPEGLSVRIEEARNERGAQAATWSATYLGEAYMAGGLLGVGLFSLFFGILAAWWNNLLRDEEGIYRKLLYASGLFAAAITMRSLFWLTTAILPTLAVFFYGRWFLKKRSKRPGAGNAWRHGQSL